MRGGCIGCGGGPFAGGSVYVNSIVDSRFEDRFVFVPGVMCWNVGRKLRKFSYFSMCSHFLESSRGFKSIRIRI